MSISRLSLLTTMIMVLLVGSIGTYHVRAQYDCDDECTDGWPCPVPDTTPCSFYGLMVCEQTTQNEYIPAFDRWPGGDKIEFYGFEDVSAGFTDCYEIWKCEWDDMAVPAVCTSVYVKSVPLPVLDCAPCE